MIITRASRPRPRQKPGVMNKLEKSYSGLLEHQKLAGEIVSWKFEALKFRLAKKTFYTPDFLVVADQIEIHEVKGHWEDDARVKIKVAAEMFPEFQFIAVQKNKQIWEWEYF